jgi:hypothetical protein
MFVIEKLVQQITIQKNSEDHDPAVVVANIDMKEFIDALANVEAMKEQEVRYQKQLEKSRRLEKELSNVKPAISSTHPAAVTNAISKSPTYSAEADKKIQELQDLLQEKIISTDPGLFSRLTTAFVTWHNNRELQK